MRFVYIGGAYREFRGRVFMHGNPVDITDRGTLEAIRRNPEFMEVKDEASTVPSIHEETLPPVKVNSCPKCGKELKKQGKHFHVRACRG